jgi:MerR family transcriptional regulator, redox-sensitive transcriptional activator SoxR
VLPRAERVSGQRRYRGDTVERLGLIAAAKEAGFSLDEISELLRSSDEGRASERLRELADRKLPEVEALIVRAERMRRWLELASTCGCSTLEACALFDDVEREGLPIVRP